MSSSTISYYHQHANDFQSQYLSQTAESVHASWKDYWPTQDQGQALDVGAGVGRDAQWLANKGWSVVAVEPAEGLRELGRTLTQSSPVTWLNDALPALEKTVALEMKFDLILLSAVWMHIPSSQRQRAFRKLSGLLKANGLLVISLRHGDSPDEREMYPVSADEIKRWAAEQGLAFAFHATDDDKLGRSSVHWETCVFRLPDDGTGAFPLIRHIVVNDDKASTYKLALLRTLVRIADGHPGAVIRREGDRVMIPMGLVSLYWAKQYLPLLQQKIRQGSHPNHYTDPWQGLGFVKEDGLLQFKNHSVHDFVIGSLWMGASGQALQRSLAHITDTIRKMPVKYITVPGSQNKTVFEVLPATTRRRVQDTFHVNFEQLSMFGEFSIPETIWHLMSQYACWIEPVIINEWVMVMKSYESNQGIHQSQLYSTLNWAEANAVQILCASV